MTQILLMRGLNDAGRVEIDIRAVHRCLGSLGAGSITSLMQNGNTICQHEVDPFEVAQLLDAHHGVRPFILAMTRDEWRARVVENPFEGAATKMVHVFFHATDDIGDTADMEARAGKGEEIIATPGMIWLYAERGAAKSKLVDQIDALSDNPLIARSLHLVNQIHRTAGA